MSHYAVVVFAEDGDFDRLLAPYNEDGKEYFVFRPVDEAKIKEQFAEFQKMNPLWTYQDYLKSFGYHQEDGVWGYRHNPQGYWDWYTLDGKSYMFELREDIVLPEDGEYRKNDYNWLDEDEVLQETAGQFWDRYIAKTRNGQPPGLLSREYYLRRYKTREQYMHEHSRTVPFAFVTPDGKWHAPGRVGFFACSDETAESWNAYEKEWFDYVQSDDNPYVSIVDCHI